MSVFDLQKLIPVETNGDNIQFLVDVISERSARTIGILGAGGSGKTTLAEKILNKLSEENAVVLHVDDYWKYPRDKMHEMGITGYDNESRDIDKFLKDLENLKKGKAIDKPTFDDSKEIPLLETEKIEAREKIIVEGTIDIHALVDVTIFLYAPDSVLMERRLQRDSDKIANKDLSFFKKYLEEKSFPKYHMILLPVWKECNFIFDTSENKLYKIK